jgi:hypothetical protein
MTLKTPQCKVFWALLSSSKHSRVPKDSKSPTFPSVGLHPPIWPKWGCDTSLFLMNVFKKNFEEIRRKDKMERSLHSHPLSVITKGHVKVLL